MKILQNGYVSVILKLVGLLHPLSPSKQTIDLFTLPWSTL